MKLAEKDTETTTNSHATSSKDHGIRFYNFQVENTADANVSCPLNSQPSIMYLDMADGSESLKDSSETTDIPWIQPTRLNKDSIEKMPQKLPGLLYSLVYYIRHILPVFYLICYNLNKKIKVFFRFLRQRSLVRAF